MDRINGIIVHNGKWDRIYHAFSIATVLASMGEETQMFLTYWALKNICRKEKAFDGEGERKIIDEGIKKGILREMDQLANLGKSFGTLRIIACSGSMELFGIKKEELPIWVDRIGGLTEVLGADNIIFI